MKTGILFLSVLFLAGGCIGLPSILEPVYDDYTISEMRGNILVGAPALSTTYVELNAEQYKSRDGKILYTLVIDYSSDDWLSIAPGESLVLFVDGEQIGLSGNGSSKDRGSGYVGRVEEKAWYAISLDGLKMIANAEEVRAKIIGTRHHVERHFSEENFRNFRRFVAKYGT